MRNLLIYLAIKYEGDYFKIKKAIYKREEIDLKIQLQPAITILDDEYPNELRDLKYPPYVLFYKGDISLLKKRKIAIVGSRNASQYGIDTTKVITKYISRDFVVISGLAKGIDSIAHINAIKTIGVIGNGVNIYYPYENKELYKEMEKNNLIISEYPLNVKPEKYHFPFRNRIIAALAEKVIVVEAASNSGTMHTVNEALQLNKEIFVVPHAFDHINGQGCNELIDQGASILYKNNLNSLFDK